MAGEVNAIIREKVVRLSDALTRPANTTTYTAGDVISEVTTNEQFAFNSAVRPLGSTGTIVAAICESSTIESLKPDLELWLFTEKIANVADNGVFAPTNAELLNLLGVIDFNLVDWKQGKAGAGGTGNSVCVRSGLNVRYIADSGKRIYGQLVVRNAYIPISGEVFTVILFTAQD